MNTDEIADQFRSAKLPGTPVARMLAMDVMRSLREPFTADELSEYLKQWGIEAVPARWVIAEGRRSGWLHQQVKFTVDAGVSRDLEEEAAS